MRKKVREILYGELNLFIDPMGCGSTAGYVIKRSSFGTLVGDIALSDCSRKIEWNFGGKSKEQFDKDLAKIDRAIYVLTSFRVRYVQAMNKFKGK